MRGRVKGMSAPRPPTLFSKVAGVSKFLLRPLIIELRKNIKYKSES
jgi:hypothetical protein